MRLTAYCFHEPGRSIADTLKNLIEGKTFADAKFSISEFQFPVNKFNDPSKFQRQTQHIGVKLKYAGKFTEQEAVLFLIKHSHRCGLWFNWESKQPTNRSQIKDLSIPLVAVSLGVFTLHDSFFSLIAGEQTRSSFNWLQFDGTSDKKTLDVHWRKPNGDFILEIPMKSLARTITISLQGDGGNIQVFLHVTHPPLVYFSKDSSEELDKNDMVRTNCLGENIPVDVLGDVETICLTCDKTNFEQLKQCLESVTTEKLRFTCVETLTLAKQSDANKERKKIKDSCAEFKHNNFEVMYAMHAFLSRGFKTISVFLRIKEMLEQQKNCIVNLVPNLHEVLEMVDTGVCAFSLDPQAVLNKKSKSIRQNQNQLFVHTCRLTPTRILLDKAQRVPNNLLFDKFPPEDFLRLSMIDDDGENLSYISSVDEENFYDNWICRQICQIDLADVRYEFLGCSNSQIREQGCYLYKASSGQTAASIREWVGDLDGIRCVSKYMARFGLALSAISFSPKTIDPRWIERIPDIKGARIRWENSMSLQMELAESPEML